MSVKLYYHPLASFCHKVLIALYENGTPFEPVLVDLGDPKSTAAFRAIWPLAKMPVLVDGERGVTVPESTIVIEYLDAWFPGPTRFIPAETDAAWRTRLIDRVYDEYIHHPMQKIVGDRLRPAGGKDPHGVKEAEDRIRQAYRLVLERMAPDEWAAGADFTLADCSAAPALFYASIVVPFGPEERDLAVYLERLKARPSYARVLKEAQPYFHLFPLERKPGL